MFWRNMSVDFQWTIWHIPEDRTLHGSIYQHMSLTPNVAAEGVPSLQSHSLDTNDTCKVCRLTQPSYETSCHRLDETAEVYVVCSHRSVGLLPVAYHKNTKNMMGGLRRVYQLPSCSALSLSLSLFNSCWEGLNQLRWKVKIHTVIFQVMASCSLVGEHQPFRETY